jgi:Arc/MetJ-type ribon-helix-helix transcriptional regulator
MAVARVQTMVQLTDQLVDALDREAERAGVSRSAVIRGAIKQYLEQGGRAAQVRRYVEGYERVPPSAPDEWGDLEREADVHGHEVARRLDAEEREAGGGW